MSDFGAALKAARPRAVAALRRFAGDLDAAEDAFQDAAVRALAAWRQDGLPDNPTGWLITAGRNRLIDAARKAGREVSGDAPELIHEDLEPTALDDDLLRLVFTCCHPALAVEHQVALTLKVIAGLSAADVAQAFLVPVRTMEQRLARARKKLSDKGIPFAVPEAAELPNRLEAVLATVYLIFNQGYSARAGALVDSRTCEEAIWLARLLLRLFPGDTELMGLLALMLCHHARHETRLGPDGALVPLPRQDRSAWDGDLITEATALLRVALGRGRPGPYQTQAAIAALHCEAPNANATDWAQIAALYAILERQSPGPVVTINRAVALSEAGDTETALTVLEQLDVSLLTDYTPYLVAHSTLRHRQGDAAAADALLRRALDTSQHAAEREFLSRVLAERSPRTPI
ncbi:MAG: sigma-70 family RNA polymerase sigma factor [Pseudomonadota bacterium]